MTTNVYDSRASLLASDSRWSVTFGRWIVYVDDANFDKIERRRSHAFMFAGNGRGIQAWKDWIRTDPTGPGEMPKCDGIAVCVIREADGAVLFSEKQEIVRNGGYFAGSGARHAFLCWNQNADAVRSVSTAKQLDMFSGGDVKFLDCRDGRNNLCWPTVNVTIDMVNQAVQERGLVMEIAKLGGPPFKLSDIAAANDEGLKELHAKVVSGELSVEAPCDEMYNSWTDDEKTKLQGVLADVFGW